MSMHNHKKQNIDNSLIKVYKDNTPKQANNPSIRADYLRNSHRDTERMNKKIYTKSNYSMLNNICVRTGAKRKLIYPSHRYHSKQLNITDDRMQRERLEEGGGIYDLNKSTNRDNLYIKLRNALQNKGIVSMRSDALGEKNNYFKSLVNPRPPKIMNLMGIQGAFKYPNSEKEGDRTPKNRLQTGSGGKLPELQKVTHRYKYNIYIYIYNRVRNVDRNTCKKGGSGITCSMSKMLNSSNIRQVGGKEDLEVPESHIKSNKSNESISDLLDTSIARQSKKSNSPTISKQSTLGRFGYYADFLNKADLRNIYKLSPRESFKEFKGGLSEEHNMNKNMDMNMNMNIDSSTQTLKRQKRSHLTKPHKGSFHQQIKLNSLNVSPVASTSELYIGPQPPTFHRNIILKPLISRKTMNEEQAKEFNDTILQDRFIYTGGKVTPIENKGVKTYNTGSSCGTILLEAVRKKNIALTNKLKKG